MHNFGHRKTVKKSQHWWRHGKHKPVLMEIRALQKRIPRLPPRMYPSFDEMWQAELPRGRA